MFEVENRSVLCPQRPRILNEVRDVDRHILLRREGDGLPHAPLEAVSFCHHQRIGANFLGFFLTKTSCKWSDEHQPNKQERLKSAVGHGMATHHPLLKSTANQTWWPTFRSMETHYRKKAKG